MYCRVDRYEVTHGRGERFVVFDQGSHPKCVHGCQPLESGHEEHSAQGARERCVGHGEELRVEDIAVPLQGNVVDMLEIGPVEKLIDRLVTRLEVVEMDANHANEVGYAEQRTGQKCSGDLELLALFVL